MTIRTFYMLGGLVAIGSAVALLKAIGVGTEGVFAGAVTGAVMHFAFLPMFWHLDLPPK